MSRSEKHLTLLVVFGIAVVCLGFAIDTALSEDSPIPLPSYVPQDIVEHLDQIECLAADSDSLPAADDSAFVVQLRQLPALVDSGCPRHWVWGSRSGLDPANPSHVQYSRVAGGVIAFAGRADEVMRAAQVVQKARALGASVELGLRIYPFKGKFWKLGQFEVSHVLCICCCY